MQFLRDLLKNDSAMSMMRFMSLLSLIFGAGITVYALAKRPDLNGIAELVAIFVGSAFGGKTIQKYIEKSNNEKPG